MKKVLLALSLVFLIHFTNVSALEIKLKEDKIQEILQPIINDYQDESGKIKIKPNESDIDIVKDAILIDVPITYHFFFDIPLNLKLEYNLIDNDLVMTKAKILFFDQIERFENISHINTSILTDTKFANLSIEEGYVRIGLFEDLFKQDETESSKKEPVIDKIEENKPLEKDPVVDKQEEKSEDQKVPVVEETKKPEEKPKKEVTEASEKTYNILRSDIVKLVSDHEEEILAELDPSYGITKVSVNEDESINITIKDKDIKIIGDLSFNDNLDIVYKVLNVNYSFLTVSIDDLALLTSLIGFDIPKGIEQITFCNCYVKPYLGISDTETITSVVENETEFIIQTK